MELACSVISESKGHDRGLFDKLVEKHHKQAYNVAYRMSGNHSDAEDLTQEAFIRAFRFFKNYKQDMPFERWLYRIMLNVFIDKLRRKPAAVIWSLDAPINTEEGEFRREIADEEAGPEEVLLARERDDRLQEALETIPDVYRITVIYVDIEGFSYEEVADATRTNIGTVRSRLFRGRRMLKDILGKTH